MKNKLLTLVASVTAIASYAQWSHSKTFRPDSLNSNSFVSKSLPQFRAEGKVQLDSVVSPGISKDIYTYSANGYVGVTYDWDSTSSRWKTSRKFEEQHDANWNKNMYAIYTWVDSISKWVGSSKYESTFDANNKETSYINYKWVDSTKNWGATSKGESTYDSKGNQTMSLSFSWDNSIKDWKGNTKSVYTLDEYGNRLTVSFFFWDIKTKQWTPSSNPSTYNYENTLDNMNRATVSAAYFIISGTKYYSTKDEYSYDSFGNKILLASYNWNFTSSQWKANYKREYAYNANGKLIMEAYYSYSDKWVGSSKFESSYGTDGNRLTSVNYDWDSKTNQWVEGNKYEYEYDKTILASSLLVPYDETEGFINKVTLVTEYTWSGSNWEKRVKSRLYYSDSPNGILNEGGYGSSIRLYPNPAKEVLMIEGANFGNYQIKDLSGKLLSNGYAQENKIEISQLHQGMYFLHLEQGNNKRLFKFVKE